eukprot:4431871-Prymnesium_polylepis.1
MASQLASMATGLSRPSPSASSSTSCRSSCKSLPAACARVGTQPLQSYAGPSPEPPLKSRLVPSKAPSPSNSKRMWRTRQQHASRSSSN